MASSIEDNAVMRLFGQVKWQDNWKALHLVLCLPQAAPLSTMRRPQGFLSGRLSGGGAKEPLWLPTGDQGRLVSEPLRLS